MTAALIHNTDNSVLKSPFANNLGGITSKYEAIGGSKRKTKRTKRSKKSKKSKRSKKTKGRGRKL